MGLLPLALRRFGLLAAVAAVLLALSYAPRPSSTQAAGIVLTQIATNLTKPTDIQNAGDGTGRLFIIEQRGVIRVWKPVGGLQATPFLDISAEVDDTDTEQGLVGLAFDPDYPATPNFYVYYTDSAQHGIVKRYSVSGNPDVANPTGTLVLSIDLQPPADLNHNAGQLRFGQDNLLYISVGDGGGANDPSQTGQDPSDQRGSILRIDVKGVQQPYGVPPGNPGVGNPNVDDLVLVYGLRNPWRFSFDRVTGDMFIGDVGQFGREEVDFRANGATGLINYGWSDYEGTFCNTDIPNNPCDPTGKTMPILEYDHNDPPYSHCAITGGFRYRGPSAYLAGQYVYGDYCSGVIWGAVQSGPNWTPTVLLDSSAAITAFGEDESGNLYVADNAFGAPNAGKIYRIDVTFVDADNDGVDDSIDNCPGVNNPTQLNTDKIVQLNPPRAFDDMTAPRSDTQGDACDTDDDNDGLTDAQETSGSACSAVTTNPLLRDSDKDRFLDGAECANGTNPNNNTSFPNVAAGACGGPTVNLDNDGVLGWVETCTLNTSDTNVNTDGDLCSDRKEAASVNADQNVNALDLALVANVFGPYTVDLADAHVRIDFDYDKNLNINAIDLALVAQQFGPC
jgi:glucose/arabinose dehydrogenase